ncbi:hypothetical protein AAMO2058_001519000 [Amorphochlora amoebiformis]
MSGIKVSKKAFSAFEEMKKKRTHKFLIFGISKEKVEVTDAKSGDAKTNPTFETFVKALCKPKTPAWGVIDYEKKMKDGSIRCKIVYVSWCPDDCSVRSKMLHGSTTNTIKSKLGLDKGVQASVPGECEESIVEGLVTNALYKAPTAPTSQLAACVHKGCGNISLDVNRGFPPSSNFERFAPATTRNGMV